MATKYWVGGSGTWDGLTNTNWAATSGGTGGTVQAPCSLDDVVFDSASNATAYTVTIAAGAVCKGINVAGPASGNVTVAGSGALYVYGDFTLAATGITRTYTGGITFASTTSQTITTNGQTLASAITFGTLFTSGSTGSWTLGSALSTSGNLTFVSGSFNTANYAVSASAVTHAISSNAFTLSLGSSTVTVNTLAFQNPALTLNAGTSSITMSATTASIGSGSAFLGATFYDVTFTSTAKTSTNIFGNNTFHNLTFATPAAASCCLITLYGNQTITGTLTLTGQSSVNRYFIKSDTIGTARTITAAAIASMSDVDFMDITGAGTASWSGTRLGNCLGNSGITFVAGANRYIAAGTVSSNWQDNIWSNASGGAASAVYFPLAQDTVIIDNAGLNTSATLTKSIAYNNGTIDGSTRTNAITFVSNSGITYGDFTLSAAFTTSSLNYTVGARSSVSLTSSGKTLQTITMQGASGSVSLVDNLISSNIVCTAGIINFNNKNVTSSGSISFTANDLTKEIKLGSGTISVAVGFNCVGANSNTTITPGTSTVTVTSAGGTLGLVGQSSSFYNVTFSTAVVNPAFYGDITFNNLTLTSPTSTSVNAATLYGNITVTGTLALGGGTSPTQRLAFYSDTVGTQRTITAAAITGLQDVDFRDIQGAGAATWSGTRLGNAKGNSGITFGAAKTVYWNLAGTQNWSATGWATSSGGTPAISNFPLAQDTAVFDDTGAITTLTIDASYNVGSVDMSSRTSAMTYALTSSNLNVCNGDFKTGSGISYSTGVDLTFAGRTTQAIVTAGKTLSFGVTLNSPSGTLNLSDALTTSSARSISITNGTFNTNNYTVSTGYLQSSNSNTRAINLGSSVLTLSGTGTPILFTIPTNLTFNAGTSTINLSSASAQNFQGGSQTFYNVAVTGTGAKTIFGSNTFNTLSNSTQPITINWTAGTTQTFTNFNLTGTAGNLVTNLSTTPGAQYTLKKGSTWNVGANSVDYGDNIGLTFSGSNPDYLAFKDSLASLLTSSYNGNFFAFF